ncbi:hypothetical protein HD806DRAFT_480764 [Xylariaceae sp. AK1471]|nr:hypothetical protein HD806DRAFT_480764 [Xylariaceae sp. AK1471]
MNPQASPDSYKEAVSEYHSIQPGLEVAPEQIKPFDQTQAYPAPERTIFGVRRATFFLSLALVIVILVAAVGGGVGGSVAVQNARSSCISDRAPVTVTTTITAAAAATGAATSTTEPLVVPTGVVKLDCPGLTDDIAISLGADSWVFTPSCGTDYSGSDFGAVIAYSFNDCLQACAAHNHFSGKDECTALTFKANQTLEIPKDYGNCWLKTGTPKGNKVTDKTANLACGALLKGSTV